MSTSDILLLGPSGSGKTQFTNAVTGSNFAIGSGLTACTSEVQSGIFIRNPEYVILDTPGFDDNAEDTILLLPEELTKLEANWRNARNSRSGQLRAIIYFYDLSQPRFIQSDLSNLRIMKKVAERTRVDAIFIVITKWDSNSVTQAQKEERERELNEKIKQHMKRELPIIPCRRDGEHAVDVVHRIIDSLPPVPSNQPAPTSSLSPPPVSHFHSTSTLVVNPKISSTSPSKQKPGFLGRIWRGIMKPWRKP